MNAFIEKFSFVHAQPEAQIFNEEKGVGVPYKNPQSFMQKHTVEQIADEPVPITLNVKVEVTKVTSQECFRDQVVEQTVDNPVPTAQNGVISVPKVSPQVTNPIVDQAVNVPISITHEDVINVPNIVPQESSCQLTVGQTFNFSESLDAFCKKFPKELSAVKQTVNVPDSLDSPVKKLQNDVSNLGF